jgi:heme A synthase
MARAHPVERRWFPTGAPQTLQIAAALLYWNAALGLILGIAGGGVAEVLLVVPIVLLVAFGALLSSGILSLLFEVALVALLLHPQSRSYYKTWFR